MMPEPMTHSRMCEVGALRYLKQLDALVGMGEIGAVARVLATSLRLALAERAGLIDVPFAADQVRSLSANDRRRLINPYCPGYGNPLARIVLVGTEHAFDWTRPDRRPSPEACFAAADCLLQGLWLADGPSSAQLSAKITGVAPHCARQLGLNRHPYEFLYPVPGGHTWTRLAKLVRSAGFQFGTCAAAMWGESAYLFELSEYAAAEQVNGGLPSVARRGFLPELLSSLTNARALVFYGRWLDGPWDSIRHLLATIFLNRSVSGGQDFAPNPSSWNVTDDYRWSESATLSPRRIVVIMQSPVRFGNVDFLSDVGKLIQPYVTDDGLAQPPPLTSEPLQPGDSEAFDLQPAPRVRKVDWAVTEHA